MSRSIEPYLNPPVDRAEKPASERLPDRFLRWIEVLRIRIKSIPCFTMSAGSPEGVIAGQKGDRYFDITALVYYTKITDTGNAGWLMEANNYDLLVARGLVDGVAGVNKFGRCEDNVDTNIDTDIWSGANAAAGVKVFIAPTQARSHTVVSSSPNDTAGGTGAETIKISGLPDWDTPEVSEIVALDGLTPVDLANDYVIINRGMCDYGANAIGPGNAGVITATAAVDLTLSLRIEIGQGQTHQVIFGFPSTQKLYINDMYGSVNRAQAGAVNVQLLVNDNPQIQLKAFTVRTTYASNSSGETLPTRAFGPPIEIMGPGIVKIRGSGSVPNMDVSAGFAGYLIDN
jgi:hypothetical protein